MSIPLYDIYSKPVFFNSSIHSLHPQQVITCKIHLFTIFTAAGCHNKIEKTHVVKPVAIFLQYPFRFQLD